MRPGKHGDILQWLKEAYRGKSVLVTGHTGFKGSWLTLWLRELGAKVAGYALDPRTPRDNFVVSGVSDSIHDIRGDIRDNDKLSKVFADYAPEIVFHLAARAMVLDCYKYPKETYDVNVGGTVNVLDNCRFSESVKSVVIITSDKCYDENDRRFGGYIEYDRLGGIDPYSSSKACAELVTAAYRKSFFKDRGLATVRAGNVIGGGDWCANRIVPDCIRALEAGIPIRVRNPLASRPWQYVLEPLAGYLILGARLTENPSAYSEAWNFGPEDDSIIKVKDLVELVLKYWGSGTWEAIGETDAPHEARFLALNSYKARTRLNWRSRLTLEDAVKQTVAWYKRSNKDQDRSVFCLNEIRTYQGHA